MNASITICDFLEQGGAQTNFFDMGRRVVEIPEDVIRRFESTEIPYPQPFLQSAWLGILIRYKEPNTNVPYNIWFVKLPLDEQGLLQQAARDDFIRHILKTLGETLNNDQQEIQRPVSDDNPHGFTPREDRMAVFHAKISRLTANPPSQYYEHAVNYFKGTAGYEQWNFVGLQGIADVVARLEDDNNEQTLINAIPQLPATPFAALCSCLENTAIDNKLAKIIAGKISNALTHNDVALIASGIRGLSYSTDRKTVNSVIKSVLKLPAGRNVEVLAAIAGRAWEIMEDPDIRFSYLENLARCEAGQQAFDSLLADLLFLPGLRQSIKDDFRKPERSDELASAIGDFLKLVQTR